MDIHISTSDGSPIYEQIARQIKGQILSGVLKPGDALPSLRRLARELRISLITTQRASEAPWPERVALWPVKIWKPCAKSGCAGWRAT